MAETRRDGLQLPFSPAPPEAGEGVEKPGVKLSQGRREGWRKAAFKIWVDFSLPYPHLIGKS